MDSGYGWSLTENFALIAFSKNSRYLPEEGTFSASGAGGYPANSQLYQEEQP
jgi:hypothetical protein